MERRQTSTEATCHAATKHLLAAETRDGAPALVARGVQALDQLTTHLAQLVGRDGVYALVARSAALSAATYAWLADTVTASATEPWARLRAALEHRDAHAIEDAFCMLLTTFVGLLERMIGKRLVAQLLHDVWPGVFPYVVKEPA
jgi:hypothetical protein